MPLEKPSENRLSLKNYIEFDSNQSGYKIKKKKNPDVNTNIKQ